MAEIKCKHCGAICDETIHDGRCLECGKPFCSPPSVGSPGVFKCTPITGSDPGHRFIKQALTIGKRLRIVMA